VCAAARGRDECGGRDWTDEQAADDHEVTAIHAPLLPGGPHSARGTDQALRVRCDRTCFGYRNPTVNYRNRSVCVSTHACVSLVRKRGKRVWDADSSVMRGTFICAVHDTNRATVFFS